MGFKGHLKLIRAGFSAIFLQFVPFFGISSAYADTAGKNLIVLESCEDLVVEPNEVKVPWLVDSEFRLVEVLNRPSPGSSCPIVEEARRLKLYPDFKVLSDLQRKIPQQEEFDRVHAEAVARMNEAKARMLPLPQRRQLVLQLIRDLYVSGGELQDVSPELTEPKWKLADSSPDRAATFDYVERTWRTLTKRTPSRSQGSLIPLPFPIMIPGSRFQESYYWDAYFAVLAMIRTDRWEMAAIQVENFLFLVENYGLIPNGNRDYYTTRSQPPMLAAMVRAVVEGGLKNGVPKNKITNWLRERAFPLVARDYKNFWMNSRTRYDKTTGLNHHWDSKNRARPERFGADKESQLGNTYRDVRAEAESGKDFTAGYMGAASRMAPVLLNAVLFKVEKDLRWMAEFLGDRKQAESYSRAATRRLNAINTYLWDESSGVYRDYHLDRKIHSPVITADIFAMLWAEAASPEQAKSIYYSGLSELEKNGGIVASNVESGKQWDSPYGWAPQNFFAVHGLNRYGYAVEASRIADKWARTTERIHRRTGLIYEKVDVVRADQPIETGEKYETQSGFLWSNAVYLLFLTDVLNENMVPIRASTPQRLGVN